MTGVLLLAFKLTKKRRKSAIKRNAEIATRGKWDFGIFHQPLQTWQMGEKKVASSSIEGLFWSRIELRKKASGDSLSRNANYGHWRRWNFSTFSTSAHVRFKKNVKSSFAWRQCKKFKFPRTLFSQHVAPLCFQVRQQRSDRGNHLRHLTSIVNSTLSKSESEKKYLNLREMSSRIYLWPEIRVVSYFFLDIFMSEKFAPTNLPSFLDQRQIDFYPD